MKLKCINSDSSNLTTNKIYDYLGEGRECYMVIDDFGYKSDYYKDRFEIMKEDNMNKIKIRKWEDLRGLKSIDRWGNKIKISYIGIDKLNIEIEHADKFYTVKTIYYDTPTFKGGHERVLEELRLCGFDVEFIEKPVLSDKQRQELEYMRDIKGYNYILRGNDGNVKVCEEKIAKANTWDMKGRFIDATLEYDFIVFEEDEPTKIKDLLSE